MLRESEYFARKGRFRYFIFSRPNGCFQNDDGAPEQEIKGVALVSLVEKRLILGEFEQLRLFQELLKHGVGEGRKQLREVLEGLLDVLLDEGGLFGTT